MLYIDQSVSHDTFDYIKLQPSQLALLMRHAYDYASNIFAVRQTTSRPLEGHT